MRKSELKRNYRLNRMVAGLLMSLWMVAPGWVYALPIGGDIVHGSGKIVVTGPEIPIPEIPVLQNVPAPLEIPIPDSIPLPLAQDMVVHQESQQLITNWQSFSIGALESVHFDQPNSSAVALNRVTGIDPSIILGKLSGNGQVFLSNPSGVVFGPGSKVDVHGLLATTLNITDSDFKDGNYKFSQILEPLPGQELVPLPGAVINDGKIYATRYVGLAGPAVVNTGSIIVADLGSVALASGNRATLDFNGDGLISFAFTGEVPGVVTDGKGVVRKGLINNTGLIQAKGGQILLTSGSVGDVISRVVNHSEIIEASNAVLQKNGRILLSGGRSGTINLSGTLDASDVLVTAEAVTIAADLLTNDGNLNIVANDLDLWGNLNSGTGDVSFTVADGADLNLTPGNGNGKLGGNDISHITAANLTLKTEGNIHAKGLTQKNTAGISNFVYLRSGKNINLKNTGSVFNLTSVDSALNFKREDSVFSGLKLFAANDINVDLGDVTTLNLVSSDFINVTAQNLLFKTDGDINVMGITVKDSAGITDSVILKSGMDINFESAASTFPALKLYAMEGVNVNAAVTTVKGDINIAANDLSLTADLNSGAGDVHFAFAGGGYLNLAPGNPAEGLGGNDLGHIVAKNLTLKAEGNINVNGIKATDTDRISDYVILESGSNITFETEASVFRALKLSAVTDINVKTDITTTMGDFVAKADSEVNGTGDFNLDPGAIITSARDIIVSAVLIDAVDQALQETRDLVLNGNVVGEPVPEPDPIPVLNTRSIQQGSLSSFLTEFFENGGSGGC